MKKKLKPRRRLRIKVVLILLLSIYCTARICIFVYNLPVSSLIVTGNTFLSDAYIQEASNVNSNTNFYIIKENDIKKKLDKRKFIKESSVEKNYITREISIKIQENKILFFNTYDNSYILEDGTEVKEKQSLIVPTIINYIPDQIYAKFINKISEIENQLILKISEVEYSPTIKNNIILDEERFIFKMNDGNTVHINIDNIEKFSKYNKIMEMQSSKGTLYLDSSNDGVIFEVYE